MKKVFIIIGILLLLILSFIFSPYIVKVFNKKDYEIQKVNEVTNYQSLKKVEDTCRSMIVSYESDKQVYLQYKDSDNEEKQSWGEQAKIRANKTAISYNEYYLKNNFVFKNNIPSDIKNNLDILE